MKKPLACKLGFHSLFTDSVGDYQTVDGHTFVFWTTYDACNYCDYRKKRY